MKALIAEKMKYFNLNYYNSSLKYILKIAIQNMCNIYEKKSQTILF